MSTTPPITRSSYEATIRRGIDSVPDSDIAGIKRALERSSQKPTAITEGSHNDFKIKVATSEEIEGIYQNNLRREGYQPIDPHKILFCVHEG